MSDFLLLKLWHQGTVATKLDRASLVYLPAINPLISEVHRCHGDKIHSAHPQKRREIRTPRQNSSPSFAALWRTSTVGIEDRDGQRGIMVFRK